MKDSVRRMALGQLQEKMKKNSDEMNKITDAMSTCGSGIQKLQAEIIMEEGLLSEVQWSFERIDGDGTVVLDGAWMSEHRELDKMTQDGGWYHYSFKLIDGVEEAKGAGHKEMDDVGVTIRVDDDELRLYLHTRPVEYIKELKLNVTYEGVRKDIAEHERQLLILNGILKKLNVE